MTLAVRVIPCLDVAAGRVVKGVNFQHLRDAGDPVELAARYSEQGADELTFLDVTATVDDRSTTYDMVQRVAEQVFIPLTVGGGIRSADDVGRLLGHGADKIGVNSAAIARPPLIAEIADRFGAQVLVNSIDADGTKQGFDLELTALMHELSSVPVIASGGAGGVGDFAPAIAAGADAVLAASVFHNSEVTIGEVKAALAADGRIVR